MAVDEGTPGGHQPPPWVGKPGDAPVVHDGAVWEWQDELSDGKPGQWVFLNEVVDDEHEQGRNPDPTDQPIDDSHEQGRNPHPTQQPGTPSNPQQTAGGGNVTPVSGGGGGGGGASDRPRFEGVPGKPKLWKVGNDYFLVYYVPGSNPPVPMAWKIRSTAELKEITGSASPQVDATMTYGEMRAKGALRFGSSAELVNTSEHPFETFANTYNSMAEVRPWLKNPEILALHAQAILEGREVREDEWMQTEWWQTHSAAERAALAQYYGDPATFTQNEKELRDNIQRQMIAAGFDFSGGNSGRIVDYFLRERMMGRISSDEELREQIERAANPYAVGAAGLAGYGALPEGAQAVRHKATGRYYVRIGGKDYKLAHGLEVATYGANAIEVDQVNEVGALHDPNNAQQVFGTPPQGRDSVEGIEEVRNLILEWLGPVYAKEFTESQIAQWAQKIYSGAAAGGNQAEMNVLVSKLRARRKMLMPEYDENLTWSDIAGPWSAVMAQVWGQAPDPGDPLLEKVMRMNNRTEAEKFLRQEGLARGNGFVVNDLLTSMSRGLGGAVRGGIA